jgi:cyclophilin family peptidyl-prolyl cis-trans isomerase
MGDFAIELFPAKAPVTVANFLRYVSEQFYEGLTVHRVIPSFIIQGGGFTSDMVERPGRDPIINEATNGLSNLRGTIAMARTLEAHSATSQFFINLKDNRFLDHQGDSNSLYGYAVFGRVIRGMDVVDRISKVPTESRSGHSNVPITPVTLEKMSITYLMVVPQ